MKKRILSIVLSLCMVLALMPQMAFAETSGVFDDFDYTISDDGKVTIDEYRNKNATEVVIPSSIEYESVAYPVTAIGNDAFKGFTSLTGINIPDSVTSIGDSAFYNCTGLKTITIPDSVTSIGNNAFNLVDHIIGVFPFSCFYFF